MRNIFNECASPNNSNLFRNRWVIIRPAPPPKLWPQITTSTESFSGLTFLWFLRKNAKILNLHHYIMFYQNCSKSQFTTWNPILCHFFYKKQGSTLSFFSTFDQKSWFLNFPYCIMFYQNCSKSQFYQLKSRFFHFFSKNKGTTLIGFFQILIKIHKPLTLIKIWKKLRVLPCFCRKNDTKWDFKW